MSARRWERAVPFAGLASSRSVFFRVLLTASLWLADGQPPKRLLD